MWPAFSDLTNLKSTDDPKVMPGQKRKRGLRDERGLLDDLDEGIDVSLSHLTACLLNDASTASRRRPLASCDPHHNTDPDLTHT